MTYDEMTAFIERHSCTPQASGADAPRITHGDANSQHLSSPSQPQSQRGTPLTIAPLATWPEIVAMGALAFGLGFAAACALSVELLWSLPA